MRLYLNKLWLREGNYLTSTTALELETLPKSLLIIGAGYIGTEIAQIFARAGVKMTLVSRHGLLPEAEPEISEALTGYFADEGISLVSGNALAYDNTVMPAVVFTDPQVASVGLTEAQARAAGFTVKTSVLAPEGSDSIQTAAIATKMGMTYEELASMIFPYLTTVERLKLAAQTFDMDVRKLSCCAG